MYIFDKLSNRIHDIKKGPVYLGRSNKCDIVLNDLEISRMHAKIFKTQKGFSIEDLSSKNGIFVNNVLINSITQINPGDKVEIGRFLFEILDTPPVIEDAVPDSRTDLVTLSLKNRLEQLIESNTTKDIASLKEEVMDIINKLDSLYEFISIINSSWELEDVLDTLLHKSMELLEAERGAILINKYPEDILLPIITHKIEREIQTKTSFSLSRVIIEKVQQEKKTILIDDAMLDQSINSESVIASRIRSVIASPIMFNNQILGTIYLDHREKSGVFNSKDVSFFNSIVSIASIAINNSNIYSKTLKNKDKYYKDKVYKNFELYKNKLLLHLKEAMKHPIDTLEHISQKGGLVNDSDTLTMINRLKSEMNDVVGSLIRTELPSIDAPIFESYDINVISLVSEIYKNIFPYAYLKDIKVFFSRPSNKPVYIKGDFVYIKDIATEVLFNVIDILEEGAEIFLNIDDKKCSLEIDYDYGPIFLEERNIQEFMDEKVLLDVKTYTGMLENKILFNKQRDRKGRISVHFPKAITDEDKDKTLSLVYKFEPRYKEYLEKDKNKVLIFYKKDTDYFQIIKDYTRLIGFNVSEATTQDELMKSIEADRPDLLLLDYNIVQDHSRAVDIIKGIKGKEDYPILLLSNTKNLPREIFKTGVDDIMFVPFKLEELELRIFHCFENSILKHRILEVEKIETVKAMIASISHELNNPLTTASINTELIQMTNPQNSEYADRIMNSLEKMKNIVQKLSNLKKVSFKDYFKNQKMINLQSKE